MFARAVVVHLANRIARTGHLVAVFLIARGLGAAAERIVGQAEVGKPAVDVTDVELRALMAGAGQRKLARGEAKGIRCAAFDQRDRLQHLRGRTRKDDRLWRAPSLEDLAIGADDDRMAKMHAFQKIATPGFDKFNSAGHSIGVPCFGGIPRRIVTQWGFPSRWISCYL